MVNSDTLVRGVTSKIPLAMQDLSNPQPIRALLRILARVDRQALLGRQRVLPVVGLMALRLASDLDSDADVQDRGSAIVDLAEIVAGIVSNEL